MNIGNPLLSKERILVERSADALTVNGVINKTGLLMLVLMAAFGYTWYLYGQGIDTTRYIAIGAIAGFILAMIIIFAKVTNPVVISLYAACQGLFLGALSATFEAQYPGIVMQAVLLTLTCFMAILAAYYLKIIRYSPGFAKFIVVAIFGVVLARLVAIIAGWLGHPMAFMYDNSGLSIGISAFVVVLATISFIIDFEAIKVAAENNVPRKQEWFLSFGLIVGLVWLYLELLQLLAKLKRKD